MDTTHMIRDILVLNKEGADTSQLKGYALVQHCPRAGERRQMAQSC
jgi:hypothetical protein